MSQSGRETMPAAEFRRVRKKLGMSMDEFAIELGYEGTQNGNRTTIKRFETGKRPVPLPVAKLAYLLSTAGIPVWPPHLEANPAEGERDLG